MGSSERDGGALTVLDCTFRDGGYYNNWMFDRGIVSRYLAATALAGINVIELGFRQTPASTFLGPLAYSSDSYLASLDLPAGMKIAVMSDAKVLLRDDGGDAIVDRLYGPRAESVVDVVRIAASIPEVPHLGPTIASLKDKGYEVCLNIMQVGRKPSELIEGLAATASSFEGLDTLYFADSFGNMDPEMVRATVEAMRAGWHGPLGIHTHDNMNLGLANSLAAIDAGVTWVDGTMAGMGRGAGNVAMEYLLHALQQRHPDRYRCEALLPLLLEDFAPLRHRFGWGPNFLYYLSALHEIHPTYLQRLLGPGGADSEGLANALEYLRGAPSTAFTEEALSRAMRSDSTTIQGTWSAAGWADGEDVLLIANGPSSSEHREAIEQFIRNHRPRVLALNHVQTIDPTLIDAYVVCHPNRLVQEFHSYRGLDRPVILPVDELARALIEPVEGQIEVKNFGLHIDPEAFAASETGCSIPARKVAPYALAVSQAVGARRIFLAGFDGFEAGDPRQQEMNHLLDLFRQRFSEVPITALTPTTYNLEQSSIYAY